ncbi:GntR family transcriptional regulator [Leuconostoc gelidum subsp. aenigmaticum]|jgi:K+/H+ antiporter YhaU regulatory subunit KhtT|uniref:GntR family transcriptional regulator n=1 Tax=Leuconostoc gelidum subsp. gelidum TaxID=1607839 RepID=A0ABS7V326_LEUGE|nr:MULTISPECIES: TrkA C-terminal domain-containing protein [Leuconostoc gelidum group]MBR2277560.1 GntR family transcriptional regulator [Leuconostoc sp.]MBZ5952632.1 GntR family transcriptional regulator [Leuconostoc gasicomitatum]MBZ5964500.1 GntR family transcriptional regulator [Leuconostoc gelidum subsp. gelidum]MBZ5977136.1 GntR family transcriptional regulator [Leuconostoc gelidum subsp. gelidum]MBZ5977902.1 GntR family transcriptional regulator [Leuconostoc gelidum subsp. gelidum]
MQTIREPRYRKIAYQIAQKIADNEYVVGSKLHARSTLSVAFGVSSETARKAVSILADLQIVKLIHGSGVEVLSREKAKAFLNQAQTTSDIQTIHKQINDLITNQKQEIKSMENALTLLLEQSQRVQRHSPLSPYELELSTDSPKFGQSIGTLTLWQSTGTTIVALLHDDELVVSPGPYAVIERGDTLYFVGNETAVQAVQNFFYHQ